MKLFDRSAKFLQKQRTLLRDPEGKLPHQVQYIRDEIARDMFERIRDIRREFRNGLDIGGGLGLLSRYLNIRDGPIKQLTATDSCSMRQG